jgi:tetratricopeptide (TPR) repeat protein
MCSPHTELAVQAGSGEGVAASSPEPMTLEQLEKCLPIQIKELGEDHPDVATTYSNIGIAYHKQGKHEIALVQLEKCFAIQIKTLGEDHLDVANTHLNIGNVYFDQRMFKLAVEHCEKRLAIQIKVLRTDHMHVGDTKMKLGKLLVILTFSVNPVNHKRAGVLYRESAAIYRKVHGPKHKTTLDAIGLAEVSEKIAGMSFYT